MRCTPLTSLVAASALVLALLTGAGCSRKSNEASPPPAGSSTAGTAGSAASGKPGPAAPTPTRTGASALASPAGDPTPLRIGVTLHPYFSWTANVITSIPEVEVIPILPGDVDAGSYQPTPEDIAKLGKLDALVVNGMGHDDFINAMIKASGNTRLLVIDTSLGTPAIKSAHGEGVNSHTFISFGNAIAQTKRIAEKLGALRPDLAERFLGNAAAYTDRLRKLSADAAAKLANAKIKRVVTVHDGYSYFLQEFGIELAGVVQPAHGLVPSAKELGEMIALMKKEKVTVVLTEEDFPEKLLGTLREATGAKVYVISHVATGEYTAARFETDMAKNAETLLQALVTDAK